MSRPAGLAILCLLATAPAWAQSPQPEVGITGQVQSPAQYTIERLAALPAVAVQGAREGGQPASYTGTPLWPLIETAKAIDGPERGAHLQHVLIARGADGYAVALAFGEIDPNFEGKPVIIALTQDGAALARPRLVVPGDKRAGRNVRDLVAIEVR